MCGKKVGPFYKDQNIGVLSCHFHPIYFCFSGGILNVAHFCFRSTLIWLLFLSVQMHWEKFAAYFHRFYATVSNYLPSVCRGLFFNIYHGWLLSGRLNAKKSNNKHSSTTVLQDFEGLSYVELFNVDFREWTAGGLTSIALTYISSHIETRSRLTSKSVWFWLTVLVPQLFFFLISFRKSVVSVYFFASVLSAQCAFVATSF